MSRYLTHVVFISDIDMVSFFFSKAILATQFDAFDKGKWHVNHMAENQLIIKFLRAYILPPMQIIVGRRSFQC